MTQRDKILSALTQDARRDIYEANYPKGEYWISYQGGGPFSVVVVNEMLCDGLLKRKFENCNCFELANIVNA